MTNEEIIEKVKNCLRQVGENEGRIISNNISEQTITHKFAEYLQKSFPCYDVDVSYNRKQLDPKYTNNTICESCAIDSKYTQKNPIKCPSTVIKGKKAIPDIIIHKRWENENLLVIEIKKDNNKDKDGWKNDSIKLKILTCSKGAYHYQLGMHIVFHIKETKEQTIKYYINGKLNEHLK